MDVDAGRNRTMHIGEILAQMPGFASDVQHRIAAIDVIAKHAGLAFQPLPEHPRGPRYERGLRSPPSASPIDAAFGSPAFVGEKALQGGHLGPFGGL
ncbi:hypothetical protein A5634_23895 [Mycobacterium asiaticum]|uniref:Uncharacterized protein n=1 Tax=Mycobacterium asiaticum TaxID=1790 RepID=A0A1A3NYI0_MYCAS|nr:hypothetical protein A5634_23895 [Mycobacterium asiaticum]